MGRGSAVRWIIWTIVALVLLFSFAVILLPYKSSIRYLDMSAGRSRTVTKYFGFLKLKDEVKDTYLSKLYKKYVSEELPPPDWWYNDETADGLFVRIRGDSFLPREFYWLEDVIARDWELFADDETWRAYLTTYFAIFQILEDNCDKREIAAFYNAYMLELRWQLDRPLNATDIPSIEDARRELEKRRLE